MSTQDTSMELLVGSYQVSCRRIREALAGGLPIRNSREPTEPPTGPGEVIGLCGQSSRHPYFRIPLPALAAAIDRIGRLPQSTGSLEAAVDELNAICQDLRQQTYFDAGTGCVNDRLPAMVPLLAPEEIWCEGKELPLDVWRLISFEFDLVSSAIASQVPLTDVGQGNVTPGALLLGHILNQLGNKMVSFVAVPGSLPQSIANELNGAAPVEVSAARLFFEIGALLTPLAADNFTRWYAGVRYLHWLDAGKTELRIRDAFDQPNIDSRYRGLFAEEMAIGLMAVILADRLGTVRTNNTVEILPSAYPSGQPIADFVAESVDPSGADRLIIAESKGSLGTRVSASRRARAKQQIQQTSVSLPGAPMGVGLTFCSSLYFSSQSSGTHCLVNDPEPSEGDLILDPIRAWRVAYAKTLRFAGLDVAARRVMHGEPAANLGRTEDGERGEWRSERERDLFRRRTACRERYSAELLLDLGAYGLMMDSLVWKVVRHGIDLESSQTLLHHLYRRSIDRNAQGRGRRSFMTGLGIGCVLCTRN